MLETKMISLTLYQISIPFKAKFRHASAERAETSSIWVEAKSEDGITGYGESCPRPYVTGETIASALAFFSQYQVGIRNAIHSFTTMKIWMANHRSEIDNNPAAWCAIELAILDMLAKHEGQSIESFLEVPPLQETYQYSAVLGDAEIESFKLSLGQYLFLGFTDYKLKLSGDLAHDQAKMTELKRNASHLHRVRLDANNLWTSADQAISYLHALDYPFFAIEEPLKINAYSDLTIIAEALNCKIILDESFLRIEQFKSLVQSPEHWLINLRVSKMGGLLRSLAIIESARTMNIGLIVGAQVGETSLLTRAGLTVANAAQSILQAQEGAFGTHLLENDICSPPLMFSKAGALNTSHFSLLDRPGLGFYLSQQPDFISELREC